MRDPIEVVKEMEFLWNEYKPDELYFDDDNFAISEEHVKGICNEILRRKLKINWNCVSPNTYIRTDDNLKQIKNIKIGDSVFTHRGRYEKVTEVFKRKFSGIN